MQFITVIFLPAFSYFFIDIFGHYVTHYQRYTFYLQKMHFFMIDKFPPPPGCPRLEVECPDGTCEPSHDQCSHDPSTGTYYLVNYKYMYSAYNATKYTTM